MTGKSWNDHDIGVATDKNLSVKEAARILGRSENAIYIVRKRVRQGDPTLGGLRGPDANPWSVGERTLLAKTCGHCGLFLDGKFFVIMKPKGREANYRSTMCRWCKSKEAYQSRIGRGFDQKGLNPNRSIKNINVSRAYYTWTDYDYQVASDPTLTVLQKACTLHRSIFAIRTKCYEMGYKSWPDRILPSEGQWRIEFPGESK
jgi:hypothetical protein